MDRLVVHDECDELARSDLGQSRFELIEQAASEVVFRDLGRNNDSQDPTDRTSGDPERQAYDSAIVISDHTHCTVRMEEIDSVVHCEQVRTGPRLSDIPPKLEQRGQIAVTIWADEGAHPDLLVLTVLPDPSIFLLCMKSS
jgi:hypothetical protein